MDTLSVALSVVGQGGKERRRMAEITETWAFTPTDVNEFWHEEYVVFVDGKPDEGIAIVNGKVNACLIVTARNMLILLEEMIQAYRLTDRQFWPTEWAEEAEAVIAKAKGEPQNAN